MIAFGWSRHVALRYGNSTINPQITQMSQIEPASGQRDPETHAIIGAAMEVHRALGCGFLEAVYHEALAAEFQLRGIPFGRELPLPIRYKGAELPVVYRVDFICFCRVIVELKALSRLTPKEESQIIHYLRASGERTGILLNFGAPSLQFRRFAGPVDSRAPQSV
jgi:GxxExxY protein